MLNSVFKIDSPLLLFFTGVTISAWYGGFFPGILATFLSIVAIKFHFEPITIPASAFAWNTRYLFFGIDCLFVSAVCGQLRSSRDRLHQSEGRLRKVFESNMIGLTFSTADGELTHVNDYFLRILGYTRAEFEQKKRTWKDLTAPEYLETSISVADKLMQGQHMEPFKKEYIRQDGSRIPVLIGATQVDKNSFVAFVLDITEITKTQHELSLTKLSLEERVAQRTLQLTEAAEELRQSRSFLDSIIENIPNMIFVKDAKNLRFVRFNRAGEILLGRMREELVGKNDFDLFPRTEADFFTQKDLEVLRNRKVVDIPDEPISTIDGSIRFLHTKKIPIYDKDNQPKFLMGISEDITDKKKAENQRAELIRAQAARAEAEKNAEKMAYLVESANEASRAKSAFLANISHEIRTPLGAMLGFTELVLDDKTLTPAQIQYLSTVERNGRQLLRLVDEILDLSKVESEHIQIDQMTFDLKELVNDVTTSLNLKANEKGLLLTTTFENAHDTGIITDPSRLRQIMVNIIGNAIKFTDRGSVSVHVSLTTAKDRHNGTVCIEVEDSGIGIDPKQAESLFKPFAQGDESMTRRFGGTGLGLFLSRKLAQLMGGNVTLASSQPARGSCFKIEIAVGLADIKVSENIPVRNKSAQNSKQGRVLIVDDAIDNRLLLEMFLKKYQVETVSAANGQEAVQAALNSHFDIVLMDVQMPIMDGFEAVKQLRDQNYTQPVIALTAHAMRGDRERCIEKGFDDYIQKPINRQTLEACLNQYLPYPTTPETKH
tara:strand:+ start:20309 stop:22630 length:2322 start_codon:yes stop_codon:yes gene_type:complete